MCRCCAVPRGEGHVVSAGRTSEEYEIVASYLTQWRHDSAASGSLSVPGIVGSDAQFIYFLPGIK